ncbi:MAG: histidine--tRNA ligase [Bacteroidetes bacterium]|nr:histidine--tRNA ligase [Bacteroidota bacterium]
MSKPSIPKGTRDFLPQQMVKRNYLFDTLKSIFKKYAFLPIETPAVENLSTLMGKYGEEGDRLIFKILNSGDYLSGVTNLAEQNSSTLTKEISEKALRYDLTVPFARFVVQNQNELHFPFKRFQIQPVWRADRPQKGRYREFFQCDVDVVGSDSLLYEVELVQIFNEALTQLKVPGFQIKINNRKILSGIAEVVGAADKIVDITVAIDKLDKIGLEKVNEEMLQKGVSQEAVGKLQPIIQMSGSTAEKFATLRSVLSSSAIGIKGVEELEFIFASSAQLNVDQNLKLDITLARGLNYYTGAIFEVSAENFKGSICGGGRYDDLTGIFGLKGVSGVGISFGADRIYDVLEENNLFPENLLQTTDVLFVNFGDAEALYSMKVMQQLRSRGISCELYPSSGKMQKQMTYANNKAVRFVAMIGTNEMNENKVTLKNMTTGEQQMLDVAQLMDKL